ncbi:MAG: MFS transporter [Rhodoferax sp.]|nr:MFS transporter [Rhodoferax sp.]
MNSHRPDWSWRTGWRYGLLGMPLAFVALPLYVLLPNHYAREFALPLSTVGALLLAARLFDALIDPWLGGRIDRLYAGSITRVLRWGAASAVVLGLGLQALLFPPVTRGDGLLVWAGLLLALTYAAFSALSVMHQSWGARLGGSDLQRSRIVAWREGMGLLGVVLASVLPTLFGLGTLVAVFWIVLLAGWLAWTQAPRPVVSNGGSAHATVAPAADLWRPLRHTAFRALLSVFVLNGIASAIPATLLLFFVQDRLQAPAPFEPLFLGSYFVAAALSIPLWLQVVRRAGLARTWGLGMALSVTVFLGAAALGAGDVGPFLLVCALSGFGLGADLAVPGAMLAVCVDRLGDRGRHEGVYFGWWNFATKMNLALAAGLALPALTALGYAPGSRDPDALWVLSVAYCLLPCGLKLGAAAFLYIHFIRRTP